MFEPHSLRIGESMWIVDNGPWSNGPYLEEYSPGSVLREKATVLRATVCWEEQWMKIFLHIGIFVHCLKKVFNTKYMPSTILAPGNRERFKKKKKGFLLLGSLCFKFDWSGKGSLGR